MRKRTLGAVVLAGLAVSGAGAFTAANDMTAISGGTTNVAGYGTATVTGATVTAVHYNLTATDQSKVDSIDFTATGNLSTKTALLSLTNGGSPVVAVNSCTLVYTTTTLIHCTFVAAESLAAFDGEALTVSQ